MRYTVTAAHFIVEKSPEEWLRSELRTPMKEPAEHHR